MTVEEFDSMPFHAGMRVEHRGKAYDLASVNFEEQLVAFNIDNDEDLYWARCENVEVLEVLPL